MKNNIFIDVAGRQTNCYGERICGDTFLCKRHAAGGRTTVILSDGMGHGVKANILSTLTSTIILNLSAFHEDIRRIGEMILKTLPVCSVRKISYSTFTFADIDHETGMVTIIEHDNPRAVIFRGGNPLDIRWKKVVTDGGTRPQTIHYTRFRIVENDRIIIMSDGITQSGQGSSVSPFGWGVGSVTEYVKGVIDREKNLASEALASKVMSAALQNDRGKPKDDMSCIVLHVRRPRKMLLVSCPPASQELESTLAAAVKGFEGVKAVCGYRVAEIIARETGEEIVRSDHCEDPDLPPEWKIEGINLVTEGLATLNKTYGILDSDETGRKGEGPAYELAELLLASDEIDMLIGSARNVDRNMYVADEFEVRRALLRRLGELLAAKYMKEVDISYI